MRLAEACVATSCEKCDRHAAPGCHGPSECPSASSRAFASCKSAVSNPSVNQLWIPATVRALARTLVSARACPGSLAAIPARSLRAMSKHDACTPLLPLPGALVQQQLPSAGAVRPHPTSHRSGRRVKLFISASASSARSALRMSALNAGSTAGAARLRWHVWRRAFAYLRHARSSCPCSYSADLHESPPVVGNPCSWHSAIAICVEACTRFTRQN
jgi:hypothetical protein